MDDDVEIISTRRAAPPSVDPLAHRSKEAKQPKISKEAKQPKISNVLKGALKGARDRLAKVTAK